MRPRTRRRTLWAVLALSVGAFTGVALPADDADAPATRYADQVSALLPLLDSSADPLLLSTALTAVRRAVAEIDQAVASAPVPEPGALDPGEVRGAAAAAHLHLAAFETLNRDFEAARRNVDRARQLLGAGATTFQVPWAARQDGGPGRAPITYYELRTAGEVESLLRATWSEARTVPFELDGVGADDLATLVLAADPGSAGRESDLPLVEGGLRLFHEQIAAGKTSFSVPLPPGLYRVGGRADAGLERTFLVPEASEIDPVVVGPERFVLRLTVAGRRHIPRLFLNGIEVRDLGAMPYGYYRVDADRATLKDAPNLIRFVPGRGSNDKSRTIWTVQVPAGGLSELRFGVAALGNRLWD
jgi:hypothetical protein